THLGEWLGIKPTGKKLRISVVNIDTLKDGKIIEHGGAANVFDAFWSENIIRPWND
ncbi:MAG: ester cyclase, partial [Desulfomonilia bacterium]